MRFVEQDDVVTGRSGKSCQYAPAHDRGYSVHSQAVLNTARAWRMATSYEGREGSVVLLSQSLCFLPVHIASTS
jgi:hypothetical protein